MRSCFCFVGAAVAAASCCGWAGAATVLETQGTEFVLNGEPTFLLGISYYGALGASRKAVRADLNDLGQSGFNWMRVWATWAPYGDVSAVDMDGEPRQPYLNRLKWLVAACDRRGMVVDVTLTRGDKPGSIRNLAAHRRAVEVLVEALKGHRNWSIDLANERDVGDARFVSLEEIRELRDLVRSLDPDRLVTASFGGHDLNEKYIKDALVEADLDFVCPHRPRNPESPSQTADATREALAAMKKVGRTAPVHYQEPFRRGYTQWQPVADDFLTDLRGAVESGAAGWCLHNGSDRATEEGRPRRSFDMTQQRLFDQLDDEELQAVRGASKVVAGPPPEED